MVAQSSSALGVEGTRLTLNGAPFHYQGFSFFNALFNPTFNAGDEARGRWLDVFRWNGVSALRIWCQWDFPPPRGFVDVGHEASLFDDAGGVRKKVLARPVALLEASDARGMVVEVCLFANERTPYFLSPPLLERAARALTEHLRPYRNAIEQIWNEHSAEAVRLFEAIKTADPERIVTSSPGFSLGGQPFDHLGSDVDNRLFDVLTPHTVRRESVPFWYVAPAQIEYLLDTYQKPVIDDEPARNGPVQFGGVPGGTLPEQHVEQIRRVRQLGAYHVYHHDMFQYGYGDPLTPPSGIPDPDFSPFHRRVFDYLRDHPTW